MNEAMHLSSHSLNQEPIRKGFGRGLVEAGKANVNVVAACADLTESTQMHLFAEAFPERFVEIGVAEQNLVTVGSGLAAMGKVPFVSSYAAFSPGRNWEQIRTTIALNDQPVKIIGSHAGISVGPDGATHQMLEDIALMRALPNMVVLAPCDSIEAQKATIALADDARPDVVRHGARRAEHEARDDGEDGRERDGRDEGHEIRPAELVGPLSNSRNDPRLMSAKAGAWLDRREKPRCLVYHSMAASTASTM